jgi:hypothetical protein
MDTKQIKEAVKLYFHIGIPLTREELDAIVTMREVCKSHLTALESVVEKKDVCESCSADCERDYSDKEKCVHSRGFNSCHDQLFPHIVQLRQGRVRVEVIEAEIIEAFNNWLSTTDEITVGFHKAAQAIVKLVEGER